MSAPVWFHQVKLLNLQNGEEVIRVDWETGVEKLKGDHLVQEKRF